MTREELRNALKDMDEQRNRLKQELEQVEKKGDKNDEPLTASITAAKRTLEESIASGNLKDILDRISDNIDYAKTAVISLSNIAEKAQDKLDGKVEEITIASGTSIKSDMWFPMILGLIQTQEFQHLMANMVVGAVK